jgi:hypothetical protein
LVAVAVAVAASYRPIDPHFALLLPIYYLLFPICSLLCNLRRIKYHMFTSLDNDGKFVQLIVKEVSWKEILPPVTLALPLAVGAVDCIIMIKSRL